MTKDFNIGDEMYLTVEEDIYGRRQLYAYKRYGSDFHPIRFEHRHLRLLVALMDMALAANPLVNPLEDDSVDDQQRNLASVIRREHAVIRETRRQLEDLHQERKATHARQRQEEEASLAQRRREEEREHERRVERAQWQRDREQWQRERAQWQAAQQEVDDEGAGPD